MKILRQVETVLELPVWMVLVLLWFAGLAVLTSLVAALYLSTFALVRIALGA
jgi:hypothetical protein